jgi:hypothetical protein
VFETSFFSLQTVSENVYADTGLDHFLEYQDEGHNMTYCVFKWGNQLEDQVLDEGITDKKMYENHYYQHKL